MHFVSEIETVTDVQRVLVLVGSLVQVARVKICHAHLVLLVNLVLGTHSCTDLLQVHLVVDAVVQFHADKGAPVHTFLVIFEFYAGTQTLLTLAFVNLGHVIAFPVASFHTIGCEILLTLKFCAVN